MKTLAKKILRTMLWLAYRATDPIFRYQSVAVLCYHSISDMPIDTAIAPAQFERHLHMLARRGYAFVPLADIVAYVKGQGMLPRKAVSMTFDDGYADFESVALPILQTYKAPATVFVVGNAAASRPMLGNDIPFMDAATVERVRANPLVEVGYHGKTHANLAKLSGDALAAEVAPLAGEQYFAYAGGNHSAAACETLKQQGYDAAFTIRPVLVHPGRDPYLLPRSVILHGMHARDALLQASPVADWYQALKSIIV